MYKPPFNLDDPCEIEEFLSYLPEEGNQEKIYERLFPGRPKALQQMLYSMYEGYATLKRQAINQRLRGEICLTLESEKMLDEIYQQIPSDYRW
jgi:hypothetical protein